MLIIDNGSYSIKYGNEKNDYPYEYKIKEKNIIKNGIIQNMEKVNEYWKKILEEYYDEEQILISVKFKDIKDYKNYLLKFLENKYDNRTFYICEPHILTLIKSKKDGVLIIDIGYDTTRIIPIYENMIIKYGEKIIMIGNKKIKENGIEILFNPGLINLDCKNLVKELYDTIKKLPIDYRKYFMNNIYLVGGGSIKKGLCKRIKKILIDEFNKDKNNTINNKKISVYAPKNRNYISWHGGIEYMKMLNNK